MEAPPQVEAKVLAGTRTDQVDIPETDPVDHAESVMLGLGQHRVDGQLQLLGESLEPGVCRGLEDHAVLRHQDAPGFFAVAVLPALLLDQLDWGGGGGGECDLVDLAGLFYWVAGSAECVLDGRDVPGHLADGAEADVAEGEDQWLRREGGVTAGSVHWGSLVYRWVYRWSAQRGDLVAFWGWDGGWRAVEVGLDVRCAVKGIPPRSE